METSLLYNTEILVNLFAVLGMVRDLRFEVGGGSKLVPSIIFLPIVCTLLYYWMSFGAKRKHTITILSMFILAFVADAIFITTKFVLYTYLQGSWKTPNAIGFSAVQLISILMTIIWIVLSFILRRKAWFTYEFITAITTFSSVVVWSILLIAKIPKGRAVQHPQALYFDRQLNYVVFLLWILPPTLIGELYAIIKGIHTWGAHVILLPVLFRLVLTVTTYSFPWVKTFCQTPTIPTVKKVIALQKCRFIVLPLCCWRLLTLDTHDQIMLHPLPTFLLVATALDTIESLIT